MGGGGKWPTGGKPKPRGGGGPAGNPMGKRCAPPQPGAGPAGQPAIRPAGGGLFVISKCFMAKRGWSKQKGDMID